MSGDYSILYDREEKRLDAVSIEDIRKMRLNDGTVSAMYNLFTLPIRAAETYIEAEDDAAREQAFIEDYFHAPTAEGVMTYSLDLLLADMLRSIEDGFRGYEKVLSIVDGHLVYRKVAPRDAATLTLLRDDHGGFAGIKQKTWNGARYIDVEIPVSQAFLFTYGKERNYLYGESALRCGYQHYDRKHKFYYLQQLAAQASALPPRKLGVPANGMENEEKLAAAEEAADNFGFQQRITLPEGWTLEEYKTNPMDMQHAIDHHDTLIARSTLMDFVVLGATSSGSFALSKDKTEMFMTALVGVMHDIENHINAYLIKPLIDWNFGSGKYPVFKFEELDGETRKLMAESFAAILGRQDLPGYVVEGIANKVSQQLGLDIEEIDEAIEEEVDKDQDTEQVDPKTQNLSESAAATRKRKMAAAKAVGTKLDKAVDVTTQAATDELTRLKDLTGKKVEKLLKGDDLSALRDLSLPSFAAYRKLLENSMMEQYLSGKRSAADEGNSGIPKTPSKSRTYITEQARAIADKQEQDLLFATKNQVTKALRTQTLSERQLGMLDILAGLAGAWDAFIGNNAAAGVDIALTGALNLGRGDSFANDPNAQVYEFTAVLDNRTTPLCTSLNGTVLTPEQFRATNLIPPLHWRCRSVWVAYYSDDSFIPDLQAPPADIEMPTLSERIEVRETQDHREADKRAALESRLKRALKRLGLSDEAA